MKIAQIALLTMCVIITSGFLQISYSVDSILAPTKQVKNGIPLQDVECNIDLERIFKISDNSPICVTTFTAESLIQRQTHTKDIPIQTSITHNEEYRILSWHDVPEEQKDHIIRMLWIDASSDPIEIANRSDEKPDGHAAIFVWKFTKGLYSHVNDRCVDPITNEHTEFRCPWLDNGIATVKERTIQWFGEYKKAGGHLDYIILDDESNFSNWALQTKTGWAKAIENDSRFNMLIPKLNQTSLEYVMDRPHVNHHAYLQWNAIQKDMLVNARNEAIFEPIQEIYPNVKASNYKDYKIDREDAIPEKNGHLQHYFSNFGTHNAKPFYGDLRQHGEKIGHDSYTVLKWQMETFEAIKQSSDIPNMAWVPYFKYPKNDLNEADYEKMMLYLICQTEEPLLFWNPKASDSDNKLMYDIVSKINDEGHCNAQ